MKSRRKKERNTASPIERERERKKERKRDTSFVKKLMKSRRRKKERNTTSLIERKKEIKTDCLRKNTRKRENMAHSEEGKYGLFYVEER